MWVEHLDIQECIFMASSPEPFHRDVKSGTIGYIGARFCELGFHQSEFEEF